MPAAGILTDLEAALFITPVNERLEHILKAGHAGHGAVDGDDLDTFAAQRGLPVVRVVLLSGKARPAPQQDGAHGWAIGLREVHHLTKSWPVVRAAGSSLIDEDARQVQLVFIAVALDRFALAGHRQAAVGLLVAGDADIAEYRVAGVQDCWSHPTRPLSDHGCGCRVA